MTNTIAFALCAALAGACVGTGEVQYAGQVRISQPELVQIDRGVYVFADADEPVFYTDDSYWLYRDQRWYRSDNYRGGWLYVDTVPRRLRVIEREPTAYVHYRTRATIARQPQPQYPRYNEPYQRDPYAVPQQPVQPVQPAQPYPNPRPPQQQPPVLPNDPGTVSDPNPYTTPQTRPIPPAPPIDRDRGPHGAPSPRTDSPVDHDRGRGTDNRPTPPPARVNDRPSSPATPPGRANENRPQNPDRGNGNAKDGNGNGNTTKADKPRGNDPDRKRDR